MVGKMLELYSRCGRSLLEQGLYEAALPISQIENAINIFRENNIIILGGDIYIENSSKQLEATYDNWFYNGKSIEDSMIEATSYLNKFTNNNVFVVFVLKLDN